MAGPAGPQDVVGAGSKRLQEGCRPVASPYAHQWVLDHARDTPDAPAIATPTARLTYDDLAARMRAMAARLADGGIGSGARVLVALPNSPAMVVASLAVQMLGGTAVEVDRDLAPDVLERVIQRTGVVAAVVAVRDVRRWEAVLATAAVGVVWVVTPDTGGAIPAMIGGAPTRRILEDGRLEPDGDNPPGDAEAPRDPDAPGDAEAPADAAAPAAQAAPFDPAPDAVALILMTSGSTGEPHGVMQTFRNIDANARSIVEYLELTARDRALLTMPLHYCYGRSVLQTHLLVGGSVVFDHRFAFPVVVMDALASEGATGFAGVPLTFEILRRQVDVGAMSFPELRYVTQAGGAMAIDTAAWARSAFAPARLFVMYGQTEATARLTYLPPERADDRPGSIGIPIPGVEIEVVDETGQPLPTGGVGQLVARGDNVTPGYLDEPEATAAILRDGWLWTGDLAYRDEDGFLFLQGRSKEILKIGGHRVSPVAIEQVIASHPDVADAAVIGIPDELLGEVPYAFVVARDGASPDDTALRDHCRARLAAYAVPVGFERADGLPRTEAGKLRRADLQASHRLRG
jgi:acyl-CoA synthetase (AMP-forming)/AMP-acid ligase II